MSRIDRLREYARMAGPAGTSTEKNIDYWSGRASQNSQLAPRASDEMHLPSTGKQVQMRDTAMRPYASRGDSMSKAKADVNHVGSLYMRNVRRDA